MPKYLPLLPNTLKIQHKFQHHPPIRSLKKKNLHSSSLLHSRQVKRDWSVIPRTSQSFTDAKLFTSAAEHVLVQLGVKKKNTPLHSRLQVKRNRSVSQTQGPPIIKVTKHPHTKAEHSHPASEDHPPLDGSQRLTGVSGSAMKRSLASLSQLCLFTPVHLTADWPWRGCRDFGVCLREWGPWVTSPAEITPTTPEMTPVRLTSPFFFFTCTAS